MNMVLGFYVAAVNWTAVCWPAAAVLVVPCAAVHQPAALIKQIFNGTSPDRPDRGKRVQAIVSALPLLASCLESVRMLSDVEGPQSDRCWFLRARRL